MTLSAIEWRDGRLRILDQLLLPHAERWVAVESAEDAWRAIKSMQVRGAPAIAIVAALSVAAEEHAFLRGGDSSSTSAAARRDDILRRLRYLVTSRPTAVNLSDAARKLSAVVTAAANAEGKDGGKATAADVSGAYVAAAERMLVDDVSDNERIGECGADWILARADRLYGPNSKISVMTHCNTGSLATAGYGTALGIVRSLWARGRLARVYYGETRPYNQGSRLTGFELLHDGIPATLVTDSMAGALMQRLNQSSRKGEDGDSGRNSKKGEDGDFPLAAVVVGADRVAANGDTANKIGTYGLAVLARHHGVGFVVAAPRTTVDLATRGGADIEIEQRRESEVTLVRGPVATRKPGGGGGGGNDDDDSISVDLSKTHEVSIAPAGTRAWNPAFDVTPAALIDAIATEVGVAEKGADGGGAFALAGLFDRHEG